jgi:hypothetical protein
MLRGWWRSPSTRKKKRSGKPCVGFVPCVVASLVYILEVHICPHPEPVELMVFWLSLVPYQLGQTFFLDHVLFIFIIQSLVHSRLYVSCTVCLKSDKQNYYKNVK